MQHETNSRSNSRRLVRLGVLSVSMLGLTVLGGCDNAGEGLFSGAALGAVTGLAIGSLSGDAGEGAVLGTIIGGASGAVIGDQNRRNRENAYIGSRRSGYVERQSRDHHHEHYHYDEWWCD